jgi:hypothetical protein
MYARAKTLKSAYRDRREHARFQNATKVAARNRCVKVFDDRKRSKDRSLHENFVSVDLW